MINKILRVSVVVPTFNEEESLAQTLSAVSGNPFVGEVIVAEGGSSDRTVEIARSTGARIVESPRGRGVQLTAGASIATGDILWFLHADTVPDADTAAAIVTAMAAPARVGGNCTLRFKGNRRSARFLSWLYPHLRKLGLLYGDSGIFVRRSAYEACGGFCPYPIFEDMDLVRRFRKEGQLVHLPESVTTSSRRFEDKSFGLTFANWTALQLLYWCGISPVHLGRIYYRQRKR